MRRVVATMMAAALLAAGCGGGDDEAAADEAPGTTAADEAESGTDGDAEAGAPDDDGADDDASSEDVGGDDEPATITSFDQIPQECLDLTADFLRAIEPIVEPIDWENATMTDFESVSGAFEAEAEAYDLESTEACDSIDLEDEGMTVMVEFARDVAPGTVGFLEFLDQLQSAALGIQPTSDDEPPAFADCDGAISFIEELIASNETIDDVPLDDMLQVTNIADVIMSCTIEQLEFFESPEVTAFFGE